MLGMIWWMYGGYAWLTNAVAHRPRSPPAASCSAAWARYLMLALAIPGAFAGSGLRSAWRTCVVVILHAGCSRARRRERVRRRSSRSRRSTSSPRLLVLAGGSGGTASTCSGRAAVFEWLSPLSGASRLRGRAGALRRAARAGGDRSRSASRWSRSASGLASCRSTSGSSAVALPAWRSAPASGGRTSAATTSAPSARWPPRRSRAGAGSRSTAFGYGHLPILLGIVAIAAVAREATAHPFSSLTWARATILAGGVAAYLAGDVAFGGTLRIGRIRWRALGALLSLAAIPIGVALSPFAETAALVALLLAVIGAEAARAAPAPQPGAP